jgi:hypothetical protein
MASVFTPVVARGKQLLDRDLAVSLPKSVDVRYRLIDFLLSPINLGHDPGNGAAVPSDNERFTTLDVIEQLRQMSLGFGSLNFSHAYS